MGLMPWKTALLECQSCGYRWVGVWELGVDLFCPECDSPHVLEGEEEDESSLL